MQSMGPTHITATFSTTFQWSYCLSTSVVGAVSAEELLATFERAEAKSTGSTGGGRGRRRCGSTMYICSRGGPLCIYAQGEQNTMLSSKVLWFPPPPFLGRGRDLCLTRIGKLAEHRTVMHSRWWRNQCVMSPLHLRARAPR